MMRLKEKLRKFGVIFMFLGVLTSFSTAFGFEIVRDGIAKSVIVIPDQAGSWETYVVKEAARELQYHVEKSTGVTLNITTESNKPETPHNYIYLGNCTATEKAGITTKNLPRNSSIIKAIKDDLFIAGRDMPGDWQGTSPESGTLMGVYNLLDRELGVRWLWPGKLGEVIPRTNTIEIKNLDLVFIPPLRSLHFYTSFRGQLTGWSGEPARKKFSDEERLWERRHGHNWDLTTRSQHSPHVFKYWERFQTSHPEFFNQLPDGSRRPDPYHHDGAFVGMCVSEPGLWRQIIEDWKILRQTSPGASIEVGENDIDGSCVCPKCLSWDVRDPKLGDAWDNRVENATRAFNAKDPSWAKNLGSLSDRYARFYLEVQNAARQTDPEAIVTGFIYANYVDAPQTIKLNSNIILSFVGRLMFPWTPEKVRDFKEAWQGWSDAGATMLLRPNFMLDGHCMPIFFARKFHDLFRFCFNHGMIGATFDSNIGQYATQGPNMYVMARMGQAPDMSFDEIMDEFYSGFGPAKTIVKEYFEFWESISDSPNTVVAYEKVKDRAASDPRWKHAESWNYFFMLAPYIFSDEIMNHGQAILDRAAAKAKDDPIAAARVDFLRKGLKNAELTLEAQRIFDSGDKYELAETIEKLDRYRASIEMDNVANMAYLTLQENAIWDRSSLKFMLQPPGQPLPDTWKFKWDPEEKGTAGNWFAEQFDDSQWYKIGIDTPWENQPVGKDWKKQKGTDYNGIGWYRNRFELKQPEPGKKFKSVLTFGAVDEACEVWVNGNHVLSRPYPYEGNPDSWREPFEVDITEVIRFDRPNILAVRVEDRAGAGGIWRPVWVSVIESAADAENLLSNGGFEVDEDQSWGKSNMAGKSKFIYDSSQVRSGLRSGLIHCLEAVATGYAIYQKAWARWFRFVKVEPGKKYRFRVWVRTEPDYQGEFHVCVLASDVEKRLNAKGTGGLWKDVVFTDITTQDEQIAIYLNSWGAVGKVWFDDAELTKE